MILFMLTIYGYAQMGGGMMGSQSQQQTGEASQTDSIFPCPMMGGYGMGPGMMRGYGMGPGMMGGYGMGPNTKRCNQEDVKAYQVFMDDTAGMRKDLHNKMFQYSEAYRNPQTNPETVTQLEKEIKVLQKKIYKKAPNSPDAKGAVKQSVVRFKCDPCDYNIDYGSQDSPDARGIVDEGFIEIKCDPCDYNIDYGSQDRSAK